MLNGNPNSTHQDDTLIMAQTLYGEARGEYPKKEGGLASLIAVGNVITNRARKGGYFGKSITEVCLKPYQFSCWNEGDPNRVIIRAIPPDDQIFALCLKTAQNLIQAIWPDLTKGSDHYHSAFMKSLPFWVKGRDPQVKIGNHIFYKLEG
jgi:N-acetylmuramoyl-L-alanine amidase